MRVLMFGWEFPPFNSGGLGTACYGITKALSKKGVEINFVLPKNLGITENFLNVISTNLPKIKIKEIDSLLVSYGTSYDYKRKFLSVNKENKNNDYCGDLIEEVYRYSLLAKDIASQVKHDIIHTHDWMTFPSGIEAKKVSGKPFVAHIHSTEFDRCGGHCVNPAIFKIEKEGIRKADRVITVSDFTKNRVLDNCQVDKNKIDIVYNAINKSEFENISDDKNFFNLNGKKIVLFLGRITLHKGPDYFLRVAKKVLNRNKNVVFVVSGSGDMEYQIIEQASQSGIADNVLFTGFLRGERLKKIYKMANLYIMPSVSEPFGITPLESLASGTPVIISKQSGVSEILNNCLKVDFWDTNEMANKILAVLENEELEECLAENGFAEIDRFNWDDVAERIIEVYERMIWRLRKVS
ncbi:MAG: glycosyltransferase family 4 protein [Patescibacteria group bacterium]|nr:glycosyltransferase family 4 protein [Patescibacteria group bacterium]